MNNANSLSFLDKVQKSLFAIYIFSILVFSAYDETNGISKLFFVAYLGMGFLVFLSNRKIQLQPYFWYMTVFAFYVLASSLWAFNASYSITKGITLIQILILCVFTYSFFSEIDDFEFVVLSLYISGLAMCVYTVMHYGLSTYIDMLVSGVRVGDDIGQINAVGGQTAFTAIIGLYYAFLKGKKLNYLLVLIPVFVSLGTGSRKALLALIVGGVLLFLIKFRSEFTFKNVVKTIAISIVIVMVFMAVLQLDMFATVNERMQQLFNLQTGKGDYDHSSYIRQDMIRLGIDYFKKCPLIGIGFGNSFVITGQEYGREMYLHNNFVEVLSAGGLFGFILYYGMYAYLLINLIKMFIAKEESSYLPLAMIITTLFISIATVTYYDKIMYIHLVYYFLVVRRWKVKESNIVQTDILEVK